MKKEEFKIGLEFFTSGGKFRCTDVGTRVITAIKLDKPDASWYNGPPYAVIELVFDENEFSACELEDELLHSLKGPRNG